MRRVHQLCAEQPPSEYASLVEAARQIGVRIGWWENITVTPPAPLAAPTDAGFFQSIAVGADATLSVKRRIGPAVARDLIREYFLGCDLVLMAGRAEYPCLKRLESGWVVTLPDGAENEFTTQELIAALRRPDPFGP